MLHRAKYAELIYQESTSEHLVVTFNGINTQADGKHFFGDAFLGKHRISALGIVSTTRNWFPRESMEELREVAQPILKRYRTILTYGTSMGGYGAIKYSGLFGADTVVAFGPQNTIKQADLPATTGFCSYYDPAIHQDVTIQASDLRGKIFIFFDPFHSTDGRAARAIASQGQDVRLISIPMVGHAAITPFVRPNRILEIFRLCREDRPDANRELHRMARQARQPHRLRKQHLARFSAARHPSWGLAICEKYPEIIDAEFLPKFSAAFQSAEQIRLAIDWAQGLVQRRPLDLCWLEALVAFHCAEDDFYLAEREVNRALLLQPESGRCIQLLEKIATASSAFKPLPPPKAGTPHGPVYAPPPRRVVRTGQVEFIYQRNASDDLVVTFNSVNTRADGRRFFGDAFFWQHGISALGIVSTGRNWFPRASMEELAEAVRPILQKHGHVWAYGTGMGAYGAIKYSGLLGVHTVVAFSPQSTIHPREPSALSAFSRYYDESLHGDVTIQARDLGGKIFVFYDRYQTEDRTAAEAIGRLSSDVRLVSVPLMGHATLDVMSKPDRLLEVLGLCREDSDHAVGGLRRIALQGRGRRPIRLRQLAHALGARHPRWALALCAKFPEIMDENFLHKLGKILHSASHIHLALAWARSFGKGSSTNLQPIKILTIFLRAAGDFSEAKRWMYHALSLAPQDHECLIALSRICRESAFASARKRLEEEGSVAPEDSPYPGLLTEAARTFVDHEHAFLWLLKAIDAKPRELATFRHLATLCLFTGFPDLSLAVLEEAQRSHPRNANLAEQIEVERRNQSLDSSRPRVESSFEKIEG